MDREARPRPTESPWVVDPRTTLAIAGVALAAMLLFAIASAVDLSSLSPRSVPLASGPGATASSTGPGLDPFLGANPDVQMRPIPGCPGGIALSDRVFVIPDPEACGFRPLAPGERGDHPIAGIIIVPDWDGHVGSLDLSDPTRPSMRSGTFQGNSDYSLSASPDGTLEIEAPSGDQLSVTPGVDGRLRISETPAARRSTEIAGQSATGSANDLLGDVEADGQADLGGANDSAGMDLSERASGESDSSMAGEGDAADGSPAPNAESNGGQVNPDREAARDRDPDESASAPPERSRSSDTSAPTSALAILVVVGLLGALVVGAAALLREGRPTGKRMTVAPRRQDDPETPDFTYEVNALDLLLHQIEHERDPRKAIVQVFAALETGLGDPKMARRRSETPGQFVTRVLGYFDELHLQLSELVVLFERARFSEHHISPDMRTRAIELLTNVRHHYAAYVQQARELELVGATS